VKINGVGESCSDLANLPSNEAPKLEYRTTGALPKNLYSWIDDNSCQAIMAWDEAINLIFCTKSFERHLGYEADDISGHKWMKLLSPPELQYLYKETISLKPDDNFTSTIKVLHKEGYFKWFYCSVSKKIDNGTLYYIAILQHLHNKEDIDELYVQSEKLSVAGQLAASVVHEIRNPLTSLKGFVQLLESGMGAKEEYYRIMNEEIEKMEAMTSELLYISKPPVNEKAWESTKSMVKDVIILLEPQARNKNIKLDWQLELDQNVYCNRSQIKQVLLNLIKNAIEAIDHNEGLIKINMDISNHQVTLDIIDNGPGIPEGFANRLGEPFLTTKENGTGLGLMVTKQLLGQHGADLNIFRNKDKGSTFRVLIPTNNPN